MGFGLWNVTDGDYDKTMALTGGSGTRTYDYIRMIGGFQSVDYVTHFARGNNPSFPVTHNFTVEKNDIIISKALYKHLFKE